MQRLALGLFGMLGVAAAPLAAGATQLLTDTVAQARNDCLGCGVHNSETLSNPVASAISNQAAHSSTTDGSYANATASAAFGLLKVYADGQVQVPPTSTVNSQATGHAEFTDTIPGDLISPYTLGFSFVATGSHSLVDDLVSVGALASLNYVFKDATTNFDLTFGNWSSTDAQQTTTITGSVLVPQGDVVELRTIFDASTYTYNTVPNPSGPGYVSPAVFSDYSHSLVVTLTSSSGQDIIGTSGHDYSSAASALPEPASLGLYALGLAAIGVLRRRLRR